MSRVDDDSAERRAEETRAAERRAKERFQKQRAAETSAFDRALAARSRQGFTPLAPGRDAEDRRARPALEAPGEELPATEGAVPQGFPGSKHALPRPATEPGELRAAPGEVLGPAGGSTQMARAGGRAQEARAPPRAPGHRGLRWDPKSPGREGVGKGSRRPDAKTEDIDREVALGHPQRVGACAERGGNARGDSGGSGDSGSGKDPRPGGGSDAMASFRLPPAALMALPPLARPKGEPGARLSGATREIVDKIVSRVLIGTNERGVPEFRLELKSSVLKGLLIRVSGGRGGRIRAVFSGGDREVLASLRQTSQELKDALASRGLTLEELVIDDAG